MNDANQYDVLIIGGGPSGTTAAIALARRGRRVALLEKSNFPRFQIGESFLPVNYALLEELGLIDQLKRRPHMRKLGAEFGMGDDSATSVFRFSSSMVGGAHETFNIARAEFDDMLMSEAKAAGAVIHQPTTIQRIERLTDDDVAVTTSDHRTFSARYLLDATGQATLLGRHLGTRRVYTEPYLRKVAYFDHFEGVPRLADDMAGSPTVIMCEEGWFWIIPLDDRHTSVGLVLRPEVAQQLDVSADRMLAWGIERCPAMRQRMADATGPETNRVRSDFSYTCAPYAGPGYFLIGDAAMFLDPVFSTGVCLGMIGAIEAAEAVEAILSGQKTPMAARRRYINSLRGPTRTFVGIVRHYYEHAFRELFLHGQGPLDMHRAVLAILAGYVFPKPAWKVRWRYRLFELFIVLQRHVPLVPRRKRFALLDSAGTMP